MRKISIASYILHKADADIDAVCKMYKENGIEGVDNNTVMPKEKKKKKK